MYYVCSTYSVYLLVRAVFLQGVVGEIQLFMRNKEQRWYIFQTFTGINVYILG